MQGCTPTQVCVPTHTCGASGSVPNKFRLRKIIENRSRFHSSNKSLNLGHFMLTRFWEIKTNKRMTGPNHVGGLITWITYKLGYGDQLAKLEPVDLFPLLDLKRLRGLGIIIESKGDSQKPWV